VDRRTGQLERVGDLAPGHTLISPILDGLILAASERLNLLIQAIPGGSDRHQLGTNLCPPLITRHRGTMRRI
jgi:hypothetical protein